MKQSAFDPGAPLLANLLRAQFPHWADLAIAEVPSAGTDNAIYRVGPKLVARLPRSSASVPALVKEQAWLPQLEGVLPIRIPHLVARGSPIPDFPAPWSIHEWIDGETYREADVADWNAFVQALATFIKALQRVDTTGAPAPGAHNFWRGTPLAMRNERVYAALKATADRLDTGTLQTVWDQDSNAPAWDAPSRWLHGDIHAQNILLHEGKLHAVIDFGGLGAGDPACELALAWRLLPAHARKLFQGTMEPDDATWRRARAWALSIAVMEIQAYATSNSVLTAMATRTIDEILRERL